METKKAYLKVIGQVRYLRRALVLIWNSSPSWTMANLLLVFLQGLIPLAALYVTRGIVDNISAAVTQRSPVISPGPVLIWVCIGFLVAVVAAGCRSLAEYAGQAHSQQVTNSVMDLLHKQSLAVDLSYYEDSSYYDSFHRAQKEATYRPAQLFYGFISVIQNAVSLLGIAALLFTFNWLLGIILIIVTLPGAAVRYWYARKLYRLEQDQTETERDAWYFHWLMVDSRFAKEVRLFNLGQLFKSRYRDYRSKLNHGRLSLSKRRATASFLTQTLASVAVYATLALAAYQSLAGVISVGQLMVIYLGFQNGLEFLQGLLQGIVSLYEDNLFLSNLYQFLDLKPSIPSPQKPVPIPSQVSSGIRFQNVSFCYSGHDRPVLSNVNFELKPGQVVALVGKNGSGKTTLVKLLCQLYRPTDGSITFGGIDISRFNLDDWQKEISVIFQDYAQYFLKAWENVWLGDSSRSPDISQIMAASKLTGLDSVLRHLPEGYESRLGTWFKHGQELSIGEWQKVAITRAYWRKSRIVILDEPTSSLDPLAEAELFQQFRRLIDGRSAILISHRFSTVQMADHIYVIDQGQIVEEGSHSELLKLNGQYATLYRAQAQHYQGEG